ncbi:MAG: helix-turn-helix transcriptional regulator, partial [Phormidesmis sp.]
SMPTETQALRALMQAANIPTYRALLDKAGISRWQLRQLRSGNIQTMRLGTLTQLATALNTSLPALLQTFLPANFPSVKSSSAAIPSTACSPAAQLQSDALQTLETWLVQWPTIAKRAKEKGDALPAAKILPFVRPVETLMQEWDIAPIATLDEQIPYDPQYHQLTKGMASPGDLVQVTHTGQTQAGKLLHRAKVKPII